MKPSLQWDIFCQVIDNFGDIGVCWRLAADLAGRGHAVRLWVDDASALAWMAPGGCEGVQVLAWREPLDLSAAHLEEQPPDVMVEAFGCEMPPAFIDACASHASAAGRKPPVWINLEYLSAESYVERCHALPSLVQRGPAAGWTKWFFYPGFTEATGGLMREPELAARQAAFDRRAWLAAQGIAWQGNSGEPSSDTSSNEKLISLFCYEPPALDAFLAQLAEQGLDGSPVRLLVAAGRAEQAVKAFLHTQSSLVSRQAKIVGPSVSGENRLWTHDAILVNGADSKPLLSISYLPLLTQADFDHLLWACDLNFVRGEDSLVRALWAGKPFIWHIYPQDDDAHLVKLHAFLDRLGAPPSLRAFHARWNQGGSEPQSAAMAPPDLPAWRACALSARARLMAQDDLTTRLLGFVAKKR
jgi:uncharacterized repeat protein (TIGR03837 family)